MYSSYGLTYYICRSNRSTLAETSCS